MDRRDYCEKISFNYGHIDSIAEMTYKLWGKEDYIQFLIIIIG